MVSIEYGEAIAETLDILKHTKKEDVEKISPIFMNFLKENALKTYSPELDHTKKIKDMDLQPKTKAILAIIYKKFWCDEEKKKEIDNILKNNEIKYQKELREKYNPDNIFKNKETIVKKVKKAENFIDMVEYKESIFTKIKNWFKRII